jgi:hypothetical protein
MFNSDFIPVIILIYASIILFINRKKNYNLIFKKCIFNSLLIPLIFVFTISNLLLPDNKTNLLGFNQNNKELGMFSLALLIVCVIVSYKNIYIDSFIALSYVWILFIIMINISCLKLLYNNKMSSNNYLLLLLVSIISSLYVIYYSYQSKYSIQVRNP